MTLDEALGQFRASLAQGRLGHGYVLGGPPQGDGGALAERVLKLLRCEGARKPCGRCAPCRRIAARSDPDVVWVEPQSKSRRITVEDIENITSFIYQTAYLDQWKAVVLLGADRLMEQAANKFLKTLEEPPPRCLFLLVTDVPEYLLPTVLSRCQTVRLTDSQELLAAWREELPPLLMAVQPAGAAAANWPHYAVAVGRAETLAARLKKIREKATKLERDRAGEQELEIDGDVLDARGSARYREARTALMSTLLMWYRDLLVLVGGAADAPLNFPEHAGWLRARAANLSYRAALRNVQTVEEMNADMESNLSDGLVLSRGFGRIV